MLDPDDDREKSFYSALRRWTPTRQKTASAIRRVRNLPVQAFSLPRPAAQSVESLDLPSRCDGAARRRRFEEFAWRAYSTLGRAIPATGVRRTVDSCKVDFTPP